MGLKIKSTTQDLFDAEQTEEGQIYQVIKSDPFPQQIGRIVIRTYSSPAVAADTLFTCLSTGDTWSQFPMWKLIKLKKGTTLVVE